MRNPIARGWFLVFIVPLAITAAGGGICPGSESETVEKTTSAQETDLTHASREPTDTEKRVLELLASGEQSKAEALIDDEVARVPYLNKLLTLSATGDLKSLQRLVSNHADELKPQQRTLFLYAACARSRFEIQKSWPVFLAAAAVDPGTPSARCALCMLRLDSLQPGQQKMPQAMPTFDALRKLVEENRDIIPKWMLAVECRTWNRNAEGAELYRQILEEWDPGPALVHQTYGNLLDQLQRHEDALVERQKTIKMEPAGWSYDGLGNTLYDLNRYRESDEAHAMAVKMDPTTSYHWSNWAYTLNSEEKFDEAIEKCRRAVQLDDKNSIAFSNRGIALEKQGKLEEALEKYRRSLALAPNDSRLKKQVADLEKKLVSSLYGSSSVP